MNQAQPTILNGQQDYFDIDRMSNSAMSNFKRSPRHYLYFKQNKIPPTPAMLFGSAFHCYILENELFEKRFITIDDDAPRRPTLKQRNAKKPSENTIIAVDFWDRFNERARGKEIISTDDLETIKRMHDALYAHEPAMELINEITEVEKPLLWDDDITGIGMKGKMDGCNEDMTIDLKTCMNAHPDNFTIDAFNNAYHRQAALYMDGRGLSKMNKGDFYFIACEKEPPYGVSVMKCANDFIKHGRMVYVNVLEDFRYWQEMGSPDVCYEWKSPFGYHDLNLPYWVK